LSNRSGEAKGSSAVYLEHLGFQAGNVTELTPRSAVSRSVGHVLQRIFIDATATTLRTLRLRI
jgi:hypothetical protein